LTAPVTLAEHPGRDRGSGVALAAMVAALSMTAQAADSTLTLACKGTQIVHGNAGRASEPINIGVITASSACPNSGTLKISNIACPTSWVVSQKNLPDCCILRIMDFQKKAVLGLSDDSEPVPISKYPPAKPGALGIGPLKAAVGTLTRP
jgi:hypothetical protein